MRRHLSRGIALGFLVGSGLLLATDVKPSQAACLPSDPSSTCTSFDPVTESNLLDRSGFSGSFSPPPGVTNRYSQARIQFKFTGSWFTPFSLSNLSLKGDGITSSLAFPDKIIDFATNDYDDNRTIWRTLDTPLTHLEFSNSKLSLRIPAGVAAPNATLEARIQYSSTNTSQLNSSGGNFYTIAISNDVPSPLPLLGAGLGLAYSRRMRSRIRASV
jgi:hypothetical protein